MINGFRTAVGFLTRVPVGHVGDDPKLISTAVPWFAVVGVCIGAIEGGIFFGMSQITTPLVAAAVAVAASLLVTGAFHYDGLADIADAFGGGWTVEQRMTILKDSRLGTYGTAALSMALIIQVATISSFEDSVGLRAVVLAHAASRAFAVGAMAFAPMASTGMGASFMTDVGARTAAPAIASGLAVLVTGLTSLDGGFSASTVVSMLTIAGVMLIASLAVIGLAIRKIGGVTGDVLGAIQVVSFLTCLVAIQVQVA